MGPILSMLPALALAVDRYGQHGDLAEVSVSAAGVHGPVAAVLAIKASAVPEVDAYTEHLLFEANRDCVLDAYAALGTSKRRGRKKKAPHAMGVEAACIFHQEFNPDNEVSILPLSINQTCVWIDGCISVILTSLVPRDTWDTLDEDGRAKLTTVHLACSNEYRELSSLTSTLAEAV